MKLGTITKKITYLLIVLMGFNLSNVFAESIKEKGIVTLMYHRFEENKYPTTNIKVHDFKKQIELIKNSQNEFINFDQLKSILIDKQAYTGKKILITIDDAFQSFYQNAWPILKKENVQKWSIWGPPSKSDGRQHGTKIAQAVPNNSNF